MSSSLSVLFLLIMIVLCVLAAGPTFFPFLRMVFHWSRAGGAVGSGGVAGPVLAFCLPFHSLVASGALAVLDGPAVAVSLGEWLLVLVVPGFFLVLSALSMRLQTSLWFRLMVSDKLVVVVVTVVTCSSSSWLVMTSVLMINVLFSM